MTDVSASKTFQIDSRLNDESDTPVLTLQLDVSITLPGGVRMKRLFPFEIADPTDAQLAAFKKDSAVTMTLTPATTEAPAKS